MANFIQALESRVLLSAAPVTAATLNADKATVLADSVTIKAQVKALFGEQSIQSKLIATAFKALPKADQAFLKTLNLDSTKGSSSLTKDISALVTGANALVSKSAAIGVSLLKKATVANVALAQKDINALNTVTTVPLANLQALFSSTKLQQDRDLIVAAFPQLTTLVDAVIAEETNASNGQATILSQAIQYQTDIGTLANDLQSVRTAVGTFPSLVGTFSGTATSKSGQSAPITFVFSTEDANTGKVTGTVTDLTNGGEDIIKGTVTLNAQLTLAASGASRGSISGQVSGTAILGKFSIGKISGTFIASEPITG